MFYTYVHMRPNGVPFYVGKGKGGRYRVGRRNKFYNHIIEKYGIENIRIKILHCASEQEAFSLEKTLIKKFKKRGYQLANLTDGGEGQSNPTEETRRKIAKGAAKRVGRHHTPEAKLKISLSNIGKNLGKKHTPEAIQLISLAGKGRKLSPEHQQKLIDALLGHPFWPAKTQEALLRQKDSRRGVKNTSEHNAKISASKMGHFVSEEQKEKQRKKMKGRKQSPEAKAKQIAAQTGRKLPDTWKNNARDGLLKYFENLRKNGGIPKFSEERKKKHSEALKAANARRRSQQLLNNSEN